MNQSPNSERITETINQCFDASFVSQIEQDRDLYPANVVDGLFAIARAIESLAQATHALGTNHSVPPLGAVELLAREVRDGFSRLASVTERDE
jgi:hypothetical protein